MDDLKRIGSSNLSDFCKNILMAAGLNEVCSRQTSEGLVLGSLRGVDSHGIQLLPHYVKSIEQGRLNKQPDIKFEQTTTTTGIINADHALGFSAGNIAMQKCMEMARQNGMGGVSVHDSSHGGMLAYYTIPVAAQGYFALCVTNTTPRMVAPNGASPFLGTNPFCYAVPLANEDPLCYDAATTQITGNKINQYRRLGMQLPHGVAADKFGAETTEPELAVNLFAFGDYKGFGIALLVDILCGVLAGMPNSEQVSKMFGDNYSEKRYLGQFYLVFKIDAFRQLQLFASELQEEIDRLRSRGRNGAVVYAPGDKEKEHYKERVQKGIPVDDQLLNSFLALAKQYKIPFLTE